MSQSVEDQVSVSVPGSNVPQVVADTVVQTLPSSPPTWEQQAYARLWATGYPALRQIKCELREGQLFLRGFVPSYYQKQVAQASVQDIPGVRVVTNEVQVVHGSTDDVAHALA